MSVLARAATAQGVSLEQIAHEADAATLALAVLVRLTAHAGDEVMNSVIRDHVDLMWIVVRDHGDLMWMLTKLCRQSCKEQLHLETSLGQ